MIRRIRRAWRWLFSRRFAVAYDPADVQWYVDWHKEKPPIYNGEDARRFGSNSFGEFRSRRKAQKFMEYVQRQTYYMDYPIYPTHIIRIR